MARLLNDLLILAPLLAAGACAQDRYSMEYSASTGAGRETTATPRAGYFYDSQGRLIGEAARSERYSQTVAAQERTNWTGIDADSKILSILHTKNQTEIEVGRLAQRKASSDEARTFADALVLDHSINDARVTSLARSAGIKLLDCESCLRKILAESGHTAGADPLAELNNLNGTEFDKALGVKMRDVHRTVIQKVTAARPCVTNPQVRDLLDRTLPTLRQHEEMAAQLASK